MTTKNTKQTTEKKKENKQNKPTSVETLYSIEEIKGSPESFGVSGVVLAGALSLTTGNELTKNQIKKAIEEFKKRKV